VVIKSDTSWSGCYGTLSGSTTVDGYGNDEFSVSLDWVDGDVISAVFQKQTYGGTLTAEIVVDGSVKVTQTTTADFGVVSVVWATWDG
jgi:hypothetical protein